MVSHKRKSPGEGTVFQRSDGKWVARTAPDDTGRRREFWGCTKTEVEARLHAHKQERSLRRTMVTMAEVEVALRAAYDAGAFGLCSFDEFLCGFRTGEIKR